MPRFLRNHNYISIFCLKVSSLSHSRTDTIPHYSRFNQVLTIMTVISVRVFLQSHYCFFISSMISGRRQLNSDY